MYDYTKYPQLLLAFILAIIFLTLITGCASGPHVAQYNQGVKYINKREYGLAIPYFQNAIRGNPDFASAHFNLGFAYEKTGNYEKAIASYKKVIQINPNDVYAIINIGNLYEKSGNYAEAIVYSKKALQIDPNNSLAHNNLGVAYQNLRRYDEAVLEYKEALRIDPNHALALKNLKVTEPWLETGQFIAEGGKFLSKGKYNEAVSSYKKAIQINPDDVDAHYHLGVAYGNLGRHQDAIISYKEATRINPNDAESHHNLGYSYTQLGLYDKAITSFKEAIRITPSYLTAHENLAGSYVMLGKYKEAISSFKKAIQINPNNPMMHHNLGFSYSQLNRHKEAIISFKNAIRINPNDASIYHSLGEAYEKMGRSNEAIAEYKKALKINPDFSAARDSLNEHKPRLALEKPSLPSNRRTPQSSGTGSGFFVSKMGHVITNAHVVQNCKKLTVGDNANKQVPAVVVNTDGSSDLALLKLPTLEMASAESKALIQKLSIAVVPLVSKGLLRFQDVRLGERILVAGYPFGDTFSSTIKVTTGVVSSTRGAGDNSEQFQLDAAVQPGNSGGPIYDSGGNIVGVVISQLNKQTFGSNVENMNFGIKASVVRQFLTLSGLNSKRAEGSVKKSTEQLAEIAQNQALMVVCHQ